MQFLVQLRFTAWFRAGLMLAFGGILPFVINACTGQAIDQVTQAQSPSTWALLQQGEPGYVVMMRHALAPGVGDPDNFRLGDCATQRNLSAEGRQQAQQLGQMFRDRNIPIARVLSSQWCRCLETAKLLDLGKVEPFPALNSFFQDASTRTQQTNLVKQFVIENRQTPGVTIMVTHQVNITELTGAVPQSGESVVLRADEQGRIQKVGQLVSP
jgi:phosphohistidine phosphatase SixA